MIAYSIGLRGQDVTDNNMFTNNLTKLAYPAENAKEVSNISEVNAKFEEIAKTLSASNYIQNVTLNCPVVSNGAKIRFTFDNVTNPASVKNSKLYIEGTYNFKEKSLENIAYYGMECESGLKVTGVQNGIFVSFSFEKIRTNSNVLIKPASIREWEYVASNSEWQINSEFDTENGAVVEVTRSSAAIMLVLDCSNSLGSLFGTVQSSAKNFIKILYDAVSKGPEPGPDTNWGPYLNLTGSWRLSGTTTFKNADDIDIAAEMITPDTNDPDEAPYYGKELYLHFNYSGADMFMTLSYEYDEINDKLSIAMVPGKLACNSVFNFSGGAFKGVLVGCTVYDTSGYMGEDEPMTITREGGKVVKMVPENQSAEWYLGVLEYPEFSTFKGYFNGWYNIVITRE